MCIVGPEVYYRSPVIGALIRDPSVPKTLELIERAESLGVPSVWLTTTGAGRDALTQFAAAAARTSVVHLGTAIIPTWPRSPLAVAQSASVIDALAPGRLRIGVGIASAATAGLVGAGFDKPLGALREYVEHLKALFSGEAVDLEGRHYTTRAKLEARVDAPVMASALRPGAFKLCGEVADGAISWMAPWGYIERAALPAMRAGAEAAGRPTPPLVFHVPVCVTTDREAAVSAAQEQAGVYTRIPSWAAMFAEAGYDTSQGFTDAYLADALVCGDEATVADKLRSFIARGAAEVIAHPVTVGDRDAALHATLAAVAAANAPS
jgi:alkanesulfonate monooxygenase SsuD/methylene tetrahydromethanopterin reductase-like flavin-dependent oxidoreductase (luciferase family)